MKAEKKSWLGTLFAYAGGEKKRMTLSVVLSVLSVTAGLAPFYCMYAVICLFTARTATAAAVIKWCLLALLAYGVRILLFSLSTGTSHSMAYTILEGLRLRLADRFLHAPLGDVESRSIGEIKTMMVDKIENLEPPLAHMIPEGAGHIVLPVVSIAALTKGKTLLVIAHRLFTIKNADNIVVLESGRIVAQRRQEELLAHCGGVRRPVWRRGGLGTKGKKSAVRIKCARRIFISYRLVALRLRPGGIILLDVLADCLPLQRQRRRQLAVELFLRAAEVSLVQLADLAVVLPCPQPAAADVFDHGRHAAAVVGGDHGVVVLLDGALGISDGFLRRQLRQLLEKRGGLRRCHGRTHQNPGVHRCHDLSGAVERGERIVGSSLITAGCGDGAHAIHAAHTFAAIYHQISCCKHIRALLPYTLP